MGAIIIQIRLKSLLAHQEVTVLKVMQSREQIINKLFEIQHGKCFICEELIDLSLHNVDVDHIIPRAKGGKDEPNNFALTHNTCNRSKLDSDLRIARCMAQYEKIKEIYTDAGPNRPNLDDFMREFGGARHKIRISIKNDKLIYTIPELESTIYETPLYQDQLSGMRYFFAKLPIEYLYHDNKINPRAVGRRIRCLLEEFLSGRPQLHVSLAWAIDSCDGTEIHIFDGQHKAVAQMLLGVRTLPVRVFLNPNLDTLLEANTRAGTTLKQIAFDKSVQRYLGSQIYWEKVEEFRRATNRNDEDLSFSEQDLMTFFKGEHREIKRYILDDIRTAVTHSSDNKLRDYVEFGGKSTIKPISYNTIEKTFFSFFIHKEPMNIPLNYKLELEENPRQLEKRQLVELMNIFAEEIFVGRYDFDRGTYRIEEAIRKSETVADEHLKAVRLAREEILYNVMRYIRDCIKRFYLMQLGKIVEDSDLFQQKFPELLWEHLRKTVAGFAALPIWINRDATVSSAVFGGKQTYDFWKHVFDTGMTPSELRVLAEGLNLDSLLSL